MYCMSRGFSLLELVIALAIATLGVSLLLPAARRVSFSGKHTTDPSTSST